MFVLKQNGMKAVSYTHLDVYKRQTYHSLYKDVDSRVCAHAKLGAEFVEYCFLLVVQTDSHRSVSYTHLRL